MEITKRQCDVYPGGRYVERVRVVMLLDGAALELGGVFFDTTFDASRRARTRAVQFLMRACLPPPGKKRALKVAPAAEPEAAPPKAKKPRARRPKAVVDAT